jgi:hypothetical protein
MTASLSERIINGMNIEETQGHAPNYPIIGDGEYVVPIVPQPKGRER